ncbi:FxsB family cyclophane-forming radical SAM/SPASM peptide maturase [Streptomyces neyagawaensis]|uniref:FxsB family cyclophane-forming radical SAM/SPASM peptide maturase n=1 Tax=Streptomyces neyagawaensis TaxID=42238 RepID=UPI0007C83D13|nr:FxsB family cyclophane-forming radical SAM/SPASM peptide maturase [Streptomyces neyagawaensis]MCL6732876.1 FxsB family radical SAM/SPASM domain protein [Streptomyces neyagawaensis]MDE1681356.1 FxsB family radical SAM/SPASM domain protein [Streptomyces neyagawaensis]
MRSFIDQLVLKVHGSCDLACDHCYVYEHADQSWRNKPQAMTPAIAAQTGRRIREHAQSHQLPAVRITLHGGEPLLLGISRLREIIEALRGVLDDKVRVSFHVQTNGVSLNEGFCKLFDEHDVQVGVSLDGDRSSNDRHRRYANGRSSHARVLRALALLRRPEFRHLYGGILCTVNIANDPIAVYEALLKESPPRLDFLLPHATWVSPPPGHGSAPAPYGAWLRRIHSRWLTDGRPVPIRLFDALVAASRGLPSGLESVGLRPVALAVVDTDGSWEQVDSLKVAYAGAPATGMTVFTHSLDQLMRHPGMVARNEGHANLCMTCLECPVVHICGGGHYAHRYRRENGFDNPSIYCADLAFLAYEVTALRPGANSGSPNGGHLPAIHHLPNGAFDAFASGAGTVEGIKALQHVQLSFTRALIAGGAQPEGRSDLAVAAALGRNLLIELDGRYPTATAQVFRHPFVQTWAVRCLGSDSSGRREQALAHVAGLAAAVAWRAGVRASLPLPIQAGLVHLPGLGASRAASDGSTAILSIEVAGRPPSGWIAIRQLTAASLSVTIDDLDTYRVGQGWNVWGRLSLIQWEALRLALSQAADELSRLVPQYAGPLGAGLRTIVPLRATPREDIAGEYTTQRAFGAAGVALPDGAVDIDVSGALLREFQRTKLTALMDMYEFFTVAESHPVTLPHRVDPVPVKQAFHALYAHVPLAELWLARCARLPLRARDQMIEAVAAFKRHHDQADHIVDVLVAAGVLAPAGVRFATGLRAAIDRLSSRSPV